MDNRTWLWRKRSSVKTIVANKSDFSSNGNEEEMLASEREASLERSLENLQEKLASVLCESNAKDELLERHVTMAEEAIAGREKAEAAAVSLKQDLDKALQQKVASNDRLAQLNAALKESLQQLSSVREEQEQRIRDAVMKTSREFEKVQKKLEEKLTDKSKRLASMTIENNHLSKAVLLKEKLIEDLSQCYSQTEAEFNTLMLRLDSREKENAFLKYEFRMLEKELEIQNEEIEFSHQSADVAHKQHLESVKKISKLEAECQRLRVIVRRRLPGPATALARMKREVEIPGRNQSEMRRRKLNPVPGSLVVKDAAAGNPCDISSKKINFLIERLCDVEEENKTLKEILAKRDDELRTSQIVCAPTASKLSIIEDQLGEVSKGQKSLELARCSPIGKELSPTSSFSTSNNEINHSELWASALFSELEHFRNGQPKTPQKHLTFGVSDMSLMDDFAEMEKLAVVTVDTPLGTSCPSSYANNGLVISSDESGGYHSDARGKELVPVVQGQSSGIEIENETKDESTQKGYDWLQDVLKLILDQNHATKRSFDDLLEDIRMTLTYMEHSFVGKSDREESSKHPKASDLTSISGYIAWKSPNTSPRMGSFKGGPQNETSVEEASNQQIESDLGRSIHKTIKLIRGIDPEFSKNCNVPDIGSETDGVTFPCKFPPTSSDYLVRVFRWKRSELGIVLQKLILTCNDLLNGKVKFENFAAELTSALDWIINSCIISQDVSCVREEIKRQLDWNKSLGVHELAVDGPFSESDMVRTSEEHSCLLTSNGQKFKLEMEKTQSDLQLENMGLKDELKNMESSRKDLEATLRSANGKGEALMNRLQESEQSIGNLQMELKTLKESKGLIEDQMENQKLVNEDLDTQLTVARVKLNEVLQKLSSLEVELEDKSHCCEELEGTCLDLQLQLESINKREVPKDNIGKEERLIQTGWEITAASAKLAECQETIFKLGKQLKALSSPRDTPVFNKLISTTIINNNELSQRSTLRDQMLAEDNTEAEDLKLPKTKEIVSTAEAKKPSFFQGSDDCGPKAYVSSNCEARSAAMGSLALVPTKKRGGGIGFLRKLVMRKKKRGSIKKASRSFAP